MHPVQSWILRKTENPTECSICLDESKNFAYHRWENEEQEHVFCAKCVVQMKKCPTCRKEIKLPKAPWASKLESLRQVKPLSRCLMGIGLTGLITAIAKGFGSAPVETAIEIALRMLWGGALGLASKTGLEAVAVTGIFTAGSIGIEKWLLPPAKSMSSLIGRIVVMQSLAIPLLMTGSLIDRTFQSFIQKLRVWEITR